MNIITRACTVLSVILMIQSSLYSQDFRAIAGFQFEQGDPESLEYTLVPPDSDFAWAKNNGFNVVQCNWPNDYFDTYNCTSIHDCRGASPNDPSKSRLEYDLDLYLQRANDHQLRVIFNLERFLENCELIGDDYYDPDKCPGAVGIFIDYVKNNPATYGYITFDEPSWRAGVAYNDFPVDLDDQVAFYNLVKQYDPYHQVIGSEPCGFCGVANEPSGYCGTYMDTFSNGQAFDILAITLQPGWSGCRNDQRECIQQYYSEKLNGFYSNWNPQYPLAVVLFAIYNTSWKCNAADADRFECPSEDSIIGKWDEWYKGSILHDQCIDSTAFFYWSGSKIGIADNDIAYRGLLWRRTDDIGFGDYEFDPALQTLVKDFQYKFELSAPWCPACESLAIVTDQLPEAHEDEPYHAQLFVSPYHPPLRWIVKDGNLPGGLSLGAVTGAITGIPTSFGLYSVHHNGPGQSVQELHGYAPVSVGVMRKGSDPDSCRSHHIRPCRGILLSSDGIFLHRG